jgi:hypothetical protein
MGGWARLSDEALATRLQRIAFTYFLDYADTDTGLVAAHNEPTTETAIKLAEQHSARLIGVDISTAAVFEGERRERAQAIQGTFEKMARQARLEAECRAAGTSASTAQELFAHCADIIVSSQPHVDSAHLAAAAVPKDVLLNAGVPMLILPTEWQAKEAVGRSILLAWNFSRESTRALHDSMPMLAKAEAEL